MMGKKKIIIVAFLLGMSGLLTVAAQNRSTKISLNVSGSMLVDVLNEIERQSGYTFIFSNSVNIAEPINCNIKGETLDNTLKSVLGPLRIHWQISENQIVLTPPLEFKP